MLSELINSYIEDKRKTEIKDNSKFRVSDAGRCHLMRYWKRQGKPASDLPDGRTQRVFEVGHVFHKWLQDILKAKGLLVECEVKVEDIHRIGHADAVVKGNRDDNGFILYDFKTVHSRKFHWKRKEGNGDLHYAMQAMTYALLLPFGVDDIRIAYISKDDLCIDEVSIFEIDNEIADKTKTDWRALILTWEKGEEPQPNPMDWECKYCIYRTECITNINTRQHVKGGEL
jgi:CRISPR/Cas system-associated exonuclease Cas4 (RecB family)